MKKKLLGILAVSAALVITACGPANNNGSNNPDPSSNEPAPSSEKQQDARVAVASVKLDRNNVSLKPEAYTRLLPTIAPENATNKEVLWTSSNPAVASVDQKGTVTAKVKGTATITVRTFDGGFTDTCTVVVEAKHAIQVKADNNVRILVAEKAEEDSVVDVKLSYDKNKYNIEGVYANGVRCGTKNSDFYFVMPKEAVTMEVRYHEIPAAKTYKDVFTNDEGVIIRNVLGGRAEVGTKVEFGISLEPGLDFTGEISASANGADVPLTKEGSNSYSFVMPNEDVEISVGTKAQNIPFGFYGDLANDVIGSMKVNGESWYKDYVPYGATVEIHTLSPRSGLYDTYTVDELAICDAANVYMGEKYADYGITPAFFAENFAEAEDDGYTFFFEMPAVQTWIEPVENPRYNEIEIVDTDNVTLVPIEEYNGRYYETDPEVIYGETLLFAPAYATGYAPRKVYVEAYEYYRYYFDSTSTSTQSRKELTLNADGLYEFTLDQRPVGPITITVSEKYETELEGAPFQGDYLGVYAYGTNRSENLTSFTYASNVLEIAADGDMNVGGDARAFYDFNDITGEGYMFDPADESRVDAFIYKNGVFMTNKKSANFSDVYKYIYFQKPANAPEDASYKLVYENLESGKAFIGKFYCNDQLVNTVYINNDTAEFIPGVTFNMLSGAEITDANASYQVLNGVKVVATVSYKGSGAANRGLVKADALYGTFKHDLGTLGDIVADGLGGMTFGGEAATVSSYDPQTGRLVFSDKDGNIFEVKVASMLGLYTLVAKKDSPALGLVGKAYAAEGFYYNDYSCTMEKDAATYKVEFFDGGVAKVTITVAGHDYTATQASKAGKFTVNGYEITVEFYATNSSSKTTWKFTLAEDFSKITPAANNNACYFEISGSSADWNFKPKTALNLL